MEKGYDQGQVTRRNSSTPDLKKLEDYGERGSASLYRGSGGGAPSGAQGRAPGQGVRGLRPLNLKAFQLLDV